MGNVDSNACQIVEVKEPTENKINCSKMNGEV
jgi:hypothetical protein